MRADKSNVIHRFDLEDEDFKNSLKKYISIIISIKKMIYGNDGNLGFYIRLHEHPKIRKYIKQYDYVFPINTDRDLFGIVSFYMDKKGFSFEDAFWTVFGDNDITKVYVFACNSEIEESDCYDCSGDGATDCHHCDGSGDMSCHNCDGRGSVDCDACGGDDDECSECEGTGDIECEECRGDGTEDCEYCDSQGSETCETCEGTGKGTIDAEFKIETYIVTGSDNDELESLEYENVEDFDNLIENTLDKESTSYYRSFTHSKALHHNASDLDEAEELIRNAGFYLESESDDDKIFLGTFNYLPDSSDVSKLIDDLFY